MTEWITAINTVGFPVVAVIAVALFAAKMVTAYREDMKQANTEHAAEMAKITEALNNNTIALTKLCEKLDTEV